ncbi:MAG: non-canonical purine NTP pyrophosphatase [Candidatus Reconcilbacillus cellulovorans]|uniref:dITP/XTP pyrophosphatase n=1 Tax=Candidatus Reconcilbacillus cellulovorans TaxID=1906605 RepID=A0A2A6E2Q0_9BACL|nr:MAG: non-canonical purine NTP pyrophosphatase [Candidatus Reconcilbacillus cellulovorans]
MDRSDRRLVIATRNEGKLREFARLLDRYGFRVIGLRDFPDVPEIDEDGDSFRTNAEKKAVVVARHLGRPVLADDSGLCVEALGGEPGVHSARYAGERAGDAANNAKLIARLREAAFNINWTPPASRFRLLSPAAFVCVLALHDPESGMTRFGEGRVEGWICEQPAGENGFGYDPHFYLPELGKTMAELSEDEKNAVSHRGRAVRNLFAAP